MEVSFDVHNKNVFLLNNVCKLSEMKRICGSISNQRNILLRVGTRSFPSRRIPRVTGVEKTRPTRVTRAGWPGFVRGFSNSLSQFSGQKPTYKCDVRYYIKVGGCFFVGKNHIFSLLFLSDASCMFKQARSRPKKILAASSCTDARRRVTMEAAAAAAAAETRVDNPKTRPYSAAPPPPTFILSGALYVHDIPLTKLTSDGRRHLA